MIRRRLWISLVGIVTVSIALLAANLIADNEPVLGLDLQGGISVVLSAEEGASAEDLDGIRDLIRDELEGRGIAEPDVRVEGENVIVDLPGVRDQREALDAVDVAGIVQLRPLMQQCTPPVEDVATTEPTVTESSEPGSSLPESTVATQTTEPNATGTTTASPSGFRRAQRRRHVGARHRGGGHDDARLGDTRVDGDRRNVRARPDHHDGAAPRPGRHQPRHHLSTDAVWAAAAAH